MLGVADVQFCFGLELYVLSFLLLYCLESAYFTDFSVVSQLSANSQHVTPNCIFLFSFQG